jgi:formate hydrogenlyase subunit 6/NADH:ubiquinone oxidoreductase subunit I
LAVKSLPRVKRRTARWTWVSTRKVVQLAALLIFLALFVQSRRDGWAGDWVNIPMRLDPLVFLAELLASKTFLVGSSLVIITLILTLVVGRAWCGWLCPMGTLLDIFSPRRSKNALDPSEKWRAVKYGFLLTILVAALFGNLTLLILDPLTLVFRTVTIAVWPALEHIVTASQTALFPIPFFSDPVSAIDSFLRPVFFPATSLYFRESWIFLAVFIGVIGLNWVAPRFWCRYLCPLGGLLGLISKISFFRRVVGEDCKECGVCSSRCPTGTIDPDRGYASDPGECTQCLECLDACPRSSIALTPGFKPALWQKYDPSRRSALLSIGAAVTGLAVFRSDMHSKRDSLYLVRPPGARENDLVSKCVRCGECMRACPTNALQPSLLEGGIEAVWTPVLISRLGYCDYSCTACGQVCPVQAIPPLSLEVKQQTVIGRAYIDPDRCIAWADHNECIICEEMCPVADKAIKLIPTDFTKEDGTVVTVKLPQVHRERCIGCGVCEYKCPVNGEAAIRVNVKEVVNLYS